MLPPSPYTSIPESQHATNVIMKFIVERVSSQIVPLVSMYISTYSASLASLLQSKILCIVCYMQAPQTMRLSWHIDVRRGVQRKPPRLLQQSDEEALIVGVLVLRVLFDGADRVCYRKTALENESS